MHVFQWLNTLDSKEIYTQVLNHMPDLQLLTGDTFQVRARQYTYYIPYLHQCALTLDRVDSVLGKDLAEIDMGAEADRENKKLGFVQ